MSDFARCVECSFSDGKYRMKCKKGLWEVEGITEMQTYCEALHYFEEYKEDGEYYDIIGGQPPVEILTKLRED